MAATATPTATAAGYAQGFATLDRETVIDSLPVEGALPPWLAGSLPPQMVMPRPERTSVRSAAMIGPDSARAFVRSGQKLPMHGRKLPCAEFTQSPSF